MHVPIPDNIELLDDRGDLVIRRSWRGPHLWFLLLFCIFWNGFLVFWYSAAFGDSNAPLMMKLFPLGHVAVGIGLTYYVVAGFLNKTDVRINPLKVSVRSYPMKWFGNKEVPIDDIKQLYTTEKISNNKNGTSMSYTVNILTPAGKQLKLLSGLQAKEQGIFIEKKIEEVLGIEDQKVAGEV
ncbi:MAG TPA: hypothetical protein VJ952_03185 [Opitutales bacterium]|nr:hypothetical protein [Opitutales bacterium]